jgi:putative endonuclease
VAARRDVLPKGEVAAAEAGTAIAAQHTRALGSLAEARAAQFLTLEHGFTVVERNYVCPGGELDLVCLDGNALVFVEVRSRGASELGDPAETIDGKKRARVIRAARHFLLERGVDESSTPCRFDVVTVVEDLLTYLPNAFEEA